MSIPNFSATTGLIKVLIKDCSSEEEQKIPSLTSYISENLESLKKDFQELDQDSLGWINKNLERFKFCKEGPSQALIDLLSVTHPGVGSQDRPSSTVQTAIYRSEAEAFMQDLFDEDLLKPLDELGEEWKHVLGKLPGKGEEGRRFLSFMKTIFYVDQDRRISKDWTRMTNTLRLHLFAQIPRAEVIPTLALIEKSLASKPPLTDSQYNVLIGLVASLPAAERSSDVIEKISSLFPEPEFPFLDDCLAIFKEAPLKERQQILTLGIPFIKEVGLKDNELEDELALLSTLRHIPKQSRQEYLEAIKPLVKLCAKPKRGWYSTKFEKTIIPSGPSIREVINLVGVFQHIDPMDYPKVLSRVQSLMGRHHGDPAQLVHHVADSPEEEWERISAHFQALTKKHLFSYIDAGLIQELKGMEAWEQDTLYQMLQPYVNLPQWQHRKVRLCQISKRLLDSEEPHELIKIIATKRAWTRDQEQALVTGLSLLKPGLQTMENIRSLLTLSSTESPENLRLLMQGETDENLPAALKEWSTSSWVHQVGELAYAERQYTM